MTEFNIFVGHCALFLFVQSSQINIEKNNMLTKYRAYKSESESCIMVTVAGKEDKLRQQNMFAADNVLL